MIKEEDLQIITLEEAKANSRIDTTDEDSILLRKCKSAEVAVLRYLNRTVDDIKAEFDGEVPSPIVDGILVITEELFKHRGATSAVQQHQVAFSAGFLLDSYRLL